MVHFISGILQDMPSRSKVLSVEVGNGTYLVTLADPERGLSVVPLSAFDVARSMRGDPASVAALKAGLVRGTTTEL